MNKTQALYKRAKEIIPGGTQLLSKRPEMMAPDVWPAYYKSARGCRITDLDDKVYIDMSTNSVGACLLGYRNDVVTDAVMKVIDSGCISSLNPPEEVELAEMMLDVHPWAGGVRFARTGGESMAVAVRIARAATGRSHVAICGYHGWSDWYLSANLGDNETLRGMLLPGLDAYGVPGELRGTAHTFTYGDVEEFENLIKKHGDKLACITMEFARHNDPPAGYLELIRKRCTEHGIMLISDEISIGWRFVYAGSHLKFGINPDLAVYSKALGNGHPIGAIVGSKEAMEGAHKSFISSTYWTEKVGPAAAIATMKELKKHHVAEYVNALGKKYMAMAKKAGEQNGIKLKVDLDGYGCFGVFAFDYPNAAEVRTLYTHLMLDKGYLSTGALYVTFAHNEEILAEFEAALNDVFKKMEGIIAKGQILEHLRGPVHHAGFKRLNFKN